MSLILTHWVCRVRGGYFIFFFCGKTLNSYQLCMTCKHQTNLHARDESSTTPIRAGLVMKAVFRNVRNADYRLVNREMINWSEFTNQHMVQVNVCAAWHRPDFRTVKRPRSMMLPTPCLQICISGHYNNLTWFFLSRVDPEAGASFTGSSLSVHGDVNLTGPCYTSH